jgi:hypothetical protein
MFLFQVTTQPHYLAAEGPAGSPAVLPGTVALLCRAGMSMAISRIQELQDCFPQLSRGTVESVLDQVRLAS